LIVSAVKICKQWLQAASASVHLIFPNSFPLHYSMSSWYCIPLSIPVFYLANFQLQFQLTEISLQPTCWRRPTAAEPSVLCLVDGSA